MDHFDRKYDDASNDLMRSNYTLELHTFQYNFLNRW